MTVYLIDGYNVLHQFLGHHQGPDRPVRSPSDKKRHGHDYRGAEGEAEAIERTGGCRPGGRAPPSDRPHRQLHGRARPTGPSWCSIRTPRCCKRWRVQPANVEVYFGSFSRSADSIIEREVYALSAGENVVVVSSDYQLQKTIFLPNVIRRSSRQFVGDLQEHTKRIANSQNCITMSHRIEERIDPEHGGQAQGAAGRVGRAAGGTEPSRSRGPRPGPQPLGGRDEGWKARRSRAGPSARRQPSWSDEELVARAKNGDSDATRRILVRYH